MALSGYMLLGNMEQDHNCNLLKHLSHISYVAKVFDVNLSLSSSSLLLKELVVTSTAPNILELHAFKMVYILPPLLISCILSFVVAHGDLFSIRQSQGQINVHFGNTLQLKKRDAEELGLQKRQNCGPSIGSCPKGQCCQASGLCGTGSDFCEGPQCQFDYSDSCDAL